MVPRLDRRVAVLGLAGTALGIASLDRVVAVPNYEATDAL